MRLIFPAWVLIICASAVLHAQTDSSLNQFENITTGQRGGYVVGNFAISAQINENNGPHAWIKINPPELGVWLQDFAQGQLWLREAANPEKTIRLRTTQVSSRYPEYQATFESDDGIKVSVDIFAPLGLDPQAGFLPGLIIGVNLESDRAWTGEVGYTLTQAQALPDSDDDPTPWPEKRSSFRTAHAAGGERGSVFLCTTTLRPQAAKFDSGQNSVSVSRLIKLKPDQSSSIQFIAGSFSRDGYYANQFPTIEDLLENLASRTVALHEKLRIFEAALPRTGDDKIDEYLRWYVSAGILLTKGNREGDVLTMGYRELNQRDSFWSSGIHLVFWKDLERKMLLESMQGQTPTGRIPTTILPTIDRGDEIDSSEYFILRIARYYRWYRDEELLHKAWPAIQRAIEYLASRDTDQVGVPRQISYWADWKDVAGVQGRTYAPHFALLWLAALKAATELAGEVNDQQAASRYQALFGRADDFINRSFEEGGLWDGVNYVDRWEDGRHPDYVLEDQVIGAYFDVIPRERLEQIYQKLKVSETKWGIRETFPYIAGWTEDSGGTPGNYHDGGIWPYLNFVDAAGRYAAGRPYEAERIIHEIGAADIDSGRDEQPGEYLNGDSGGHRGFPIQAWDADLFSAIYFGAFGIKRTSRSEIAVHVQIPESRNFVTRLVLPECSGVLSRRDKKLNWIEDHNDCGKQRIQVRLVEGH